MDEVQSDVIFRPMIATGSRDCHRPAPWGTPEVSYPTCEDPKTGVVSCGKNQKQYFFSENERMLPENQCSSPPRHQAPVCNTQKNLSTPVM